MDALYYTIAVLIIAFVVALVREARRTTRAAPPNPTSPPVTGVAVLICHRRATGCSRRRLASEWAPARATLVDSLAGRIGFRRYVQVHHVSRLHKLYRLIQFSRSWPVTALFSWMHRLPIPPVRLLDANAGIEDWDVIELFEFSDPDSAAAFLEHKADAALTLLSADAVPWTARRDVLAMPITQAFANNSSEAYPVVNLYLLRARPTVGRLRMLEYWLLSHHYYVLSLQRLLRFRHYDQIVAQHNERLESVAQHWASHPSERWDGVAMLGYHGMGDLWRGVIDPRVQVANFGLVFDETRFADVGRSSLMLGRVLERR